MFRNAAGLLDTRAMAHAARAVLASGNLAAVPVTQRVGELPPGLRQSLDIARAAARADRFEIPDPVILFDEPTTAFDQQHEENFLHLQDRLRGRVVVAPIASRTRFGLYIYAIGGNERVVRLSGIALRRVKILAFAASGVTAALAGLLISAQLGSSGPSLGSTALLDSLAAIVVGGTALSGGVGGVGRTFLGVLIITVLVNGLNQMGVQDFAQTMIKGAVIVLAAIFTMASQRGLTIK